jgi:hypothetical protein
MTKQEIIEAIKEKVGPQSLYIWYVGVTHDPDNTLAYWRDIEPHFTGYWVNYQAESLGEAQDVVAHFIRLKMHDGTKETLSASRTAYVFVF